MNSKATGAHESVNLFNSCVTDRSNRSVLVDKSCPNLINTGPRCSRATRNFFSLSSTLIKVFNSGLKEGVSLLKIPVFLMLKKIYISLKILIFALYELKLCR